MGMGGKRKAYKFATGFDRGEDADGLESGEGRWEYTEEFNDVLDLRNRSDVIVVSG